jgi:hypothetical protein
MANVVRPIVSWDHFAAIREGAIQSDDLRSSDGNSYDGVCCPRKSFSACFRKFEQDSCIPNSIRRSIFWRSVKFAGWRAAEISTMRNLC